MKDVSGKILISSNFYHRLKAMKLMNLLSFDYEKFGQFLLGYPLGDLASKWGDLTITGRFAILYAWKQLPFQKI